MYINIIKKLVKKILTWASVKKVCYSFTYMLTFVEGSDGNMNIYLYCIRIVCKGYLARKWSRKGNK